MKNKWIYPNKQSQKSDLWAKESFQDWIFTTKNQFFVSDLKQKIKKIETFHQISEKLAEFQRKDGLGGV